MRKASLARFLIQCAVSLVVAVPLRAADAPLPPDALEKQREWVREVERGDYFFWERFFYRRDNPGEFPLPPSGTGPTSSCWASRASRSSCDRLRSASCARRPSRSSRLTCGHGRPARST
jgi:hypothetical protein